MVYCTKEKYLSRCVYMNDWNERRNTSLFIQPSFSLIPLFLALHIDRERTVSILLDAFLISTFF